MANLPQFVTSCCIVAGISCAAPALEGNLLTGDFGFVEFPEAYAPAVEQRDSAKFGQLGAAGETPYAEAQPWMLPARPSPDFLWAPGLGTDAQAWNWRIEAIAAEGAAPVGDPVKEARPASTFRDGISAGSAGFFPRTALSFGTSLGCGILLMFAARKLRSRWI